MGKMNMPSVIVSFNEKGISAIERSERGILAIILEDNAIEKPFTVYTVDDIPEKLNDYSKQEIKLALMGYQNAPRKIRVYGIAELKEGETADYTDTLKKLETDRFDWLTIPAIKADKTADIASWIKSMRTVKDVKVKAVLPNTAADNEGIVNFTNKVIKAGDKVYSTADYCVRVAGIICGTPMTISCTYAPAPELTEVEAYTNDEMDDKCNNGEFFFFNDGEKIKVARGINSFVTTMQGKGDDFKKIKLVDLMDMIHDDIKRTGHDSYIGKYANSYDNRCLLITAINGYFHTLESEGLLERGQNECFVDIEAVKNWRESNGLNTRDELEVMKNQTIKELNLHDNVFLGANLALLDAIEQITVKCSIE